MTALAFLDGVKVIRGLPPSPRQSCAKSGLVKEGGARRKRVRGSLISNSQPFHTMLVERVSRRQRAMSQAT